MTTAETLLDAVRRVVADRRTDGDPWARVQDAIADARASLDREDIRVLERESLMSRDEAAAYRAVLAADPDVLHDAVDEAVRTDDLSAAGDVDEGAEIVGSIEDTDAAVACADAAVACAGAAVAVAQAARKAREQGDEDAVGVVVVEDVEAPCDEDGGF